jgi:hypothetical protein
LDVARRLAGDVERDDEAAIIPVVLEPGFEAVALLEGGLLDRFLTRCAGLLPEDEAELARRWLEVEHRVWVVDRTRPGSSLALTDLHRGDTIEAVNGPVSRCTSPGEVVFAATVPSGEGWFLPCHPIGLSAKGAEAVVAQIEHGLDPMVVAGSVMREHRRATM